MKKFDFLRVFMLVSVFTYVIQGGANAQRIWSKGDSIQQIVDSRPDSSRHGFFNAGRFNSTFHVQFEGDATYLYGHYAAITGFEVAWVVNHKLSFGAKFDILTSPVKVNKYINSVDTLSDGVTANSIHPLSISGMINVGYIFRSSKKISIQPSFGVGWTRLTFTDPKVGWIDTTEAKSINFSSNYLIINPSVSVIWNATKYFRIGGIVGAQGVFGTDYLRLKTYRIRSVYAGLFLRFGTF